MGGLDTALVAPPEGDLADYLASLERLRGLGAAGDLSRRTDRPSRTRWPRWTRYLKHRQDREAQVLAGLGRSQCVCGAADGPGVRGRAGARSCARTRGPRCMRTWQHLEKTGRVRRGRMGWERHT